MSVDVAPGTVIERYTIEGLLGQGGMAAVYRARHNQLGTMFALKLLTVPQRAVRVRLIAEGRVQASMQHPNIVNVTDVVEYEGAPGLVMELIRGPSLDRLLSQRRLTLEQVEIVASGILAGVRVAHERGLIHRDLKPANVMLAAQHGGMVPKVTDFGIAKVLGDEGNATSTRTGSTMGTPAYMAPEQIRNAKGVDARADVWSLGAILYELVTGQRAFPGEDLLDLFAAVGAARFVPPRELVPDLPERMERAIVGALVVDRDKRIKSVAELQEVWTGDANSGSKPRGPWDDELMSAYVDRQDTPNSISKSVPQATTRSSVPENAGVEGSAATYSADDHVAVAVAPGAMSAVAPAFPPSAVLAQTIGPGPLESPKYRVLGVLGAGGFGQVYKARCEAPGGFVKDVAIKLLRPDMAKESVLQRFRDEARILGLVRDRALVAVDPPMQLNGRWAVVMEYVEGASVSQLDQRAAIPPSVVLEVVEEVARLFRRLYEHPGHDGRPLQLVHRDLKPGNVQISSTGEVKVLDFGVARAVFAGREAATLHEVVGTPGYIAPERNNGIEGPAGDVFSLGVMLHRLVTRAMPSTDPSAPDVPAGDAALQLALKARAPDPAARPTMAVLEAECARIRATLTGPTLRAWAATAVPGAVAIGTDALVGTVLSAGTDTSAAHVPWTQPVPSGSTASAGVATANGDVPTLVPSSTQPRAKRSAGWAIPVVLVVGVLGLLVVVALVVGIGVGVGLSTGGGEGPTAVVTPSTSLPPRPPPVDPAPAADPTPAAVEPAPAAVDPAPAAVEPAPAAVEPAPAAVDPAPVAPPPAPVPDKPVTPPKPPPRPAAGSARVSVSGDAKSVWLIKGTKRVALPGDVAPGTYQIHGDFGGSDTDVVAGELVVEAGDKQTVKCSSALRRCK